MQIFNWLKERFFERSSKIWISQVLGLLVIIGVVPSETQTKVIDTIEQGQEVYEEAADSVESAIDFGKVKVDEGKQIIERAKDTGNRFKVILGGLWMAILSAIGFATKDAKQGQEYQRREEILVTEMKRAGLDVPSLA